MSGREDMCRNPGEPPWAVRKRKRAAFGSHPMSSSTGSFRLPVPKPWAHGDLQGNPQLPTHRLSGTLVERISRGTFMAEVTARRRGELVRAVFDVLIEHPDGLPAKDVLQRVAGRLKLSEFEKADYPNRPGVRRFEKHVRFATIKAVKAGWLLKKKGEWIITSEGADAFKKYSDPEQLEREAGKLYRRWADSRPESPEPDADEPEVSAETTIEEAEENAWREVERYLTSMPPYDFQALVAALLRGMGYHVAWVAPPGKDGGIDILAHTDVLGTSTPRIKVQVKRQQSKVSVDGLRSFLAVLGDQDVGLFVSTGGFTSDAENEARHQEKRRVTLVDLEALFDLWTEHYERVEESDRALLPLRSVYYLAPSD